MDFIAFAITVWFASKMLLDFEESERLRLGVLKQIRRPEGMSNLQRKRGAGNATLAPMQDKIFLRGLAVRCKIGIFDWERKIRQKVLVDLEFPADIRKAARRDRIQDATDYKKIAKHVLRFVSQSQFYLIETLAERLAGSLLKDFKLKEVRLRISKPGAIRGAQNVGVEIHRRHG